MDLKDIKEIQIMDRSGFLQELEKFVEIDADRTVVLTVEMTKRRLNDSTPLPDGGVQALIDNTEFLLSMARRKSIPVIHCLSGLRDVETEFQENRTWRKHMIAIGASISPYGMVPSETIEVQDGTFEPDLAVSVQDGDYIIKTKKSYSSFYNTDLEWLLKMLDRDHLVLAGLSTNADILSTAYDASNKSLGVITIKECVASVYGEDLNIMGLEQLSRCQGFVLDLKTFAKKISA